MFLRSFFKKKGNYLLWLLMLCLVIPIIYACGDTIVDEIVSPHILRGNASKGPIYPGVVNAYKILANQKDGVLGTAKTDSNGEYIISFEGYTGPVILEAYGEYYDEATGEKKQIDPNKPLHAMISSTSGVIKVTITPLTEIAYQRATVIGKGKDPTDPNIVVFDSSTIEQANSEIINIFGIDIIRTLPIDITEPYAVNNADNEDEVIYGLYLAAISKMASDPNYNVNDPIEMVSILASQFKDGKPGERIDKDEITLPEIGQVLIDITNDPNIVANDPNIYPPEIKDQLSKIANKKNMFINVAYFDPNGVPLIPSPVSGDTPLAQAMAMIDELRNTVLTLWNYQIVGDPSALERSVAEIENDVIPELEELGEMAYILSAGIQKILEDPNNEIGLNIFLEPDPNESLQYSVNIDCNDLDTFLMHYMDCNDVNYDITLVLDIDSNTELSLGFDPNILAEILVDPNDPKAQSELMEILGGLPSVEANYSIVKVKDDSDYGTGDLTFSLDPNGKINGLIFTGNLRLSSGFASLTNCGIDFWTDPNNSDKSGIILHFGLLETPMVKVDNSLEIIVEGATEGDNIIPKGLHLLSLTGSFMTSHVEWDGNITLFEPVWNVTTGIIGYDPNMEIGYIPSKISLIGKYTVLDGSLSFDGTIEGISNGLEYYDFQDPDASDPNVTISFIGKLKIAGRPEMLFTMEISTTQTDIYEIDNLSFAYGGISIWGDGRINPNADRVFFDLQNQDGIDVHLDFSQGDFSGWIKKGIEDLGIFEERRGIPLVKYSNDHIESIF